jgi:hypothetical protein
MDPAQNPTRDPKNARQERWEGFVNGAGVGGIWGLITIFYILTVRPWDWPIGVSALIIFTSVLGAIGYAVGPKGLYPLLTIWPSPF